MSLRIKIVAAVIALSTGATAMVGVFSYRTTEAQLNSQIENSLAQTTTQLLGQPRLVESFHRAQSRPTVRILRRLRTAGDVPVQFVAANGTVVSPSGTRLPVDAATLELAMSPTRRELLTDVAVDGANYRMLTAALGRSDGAIQTARGLAEAEAVLRALQVRIFSAALVITAVAALVGWFIAGRMTRRLVQLSDAAELVATTGNLVVPVPTSGSDETGRLGQAFAEMLGALSRSREDQRRLVQDAGHELRTPLTSLRTNIFALRHSGTLQPEQQRQLLEDLTIETEELTALMNEVIELGTEQRSDEAESQIVLRELIDHVAIRAAKRSHREVLVDSDESVVIGQLASLTRALTNLVENAVKFDPGDAPVTITCRSGRVEVSDRGPGLSDDDREHVFDRFYRSPRTRGHPGSGLGLAIVADVVARHGGRVFANNRPEGGATVGFEIPTI